MVAFFVAIFLNRGFSLNAQKQFSHLEQQSLLFQIEQLWRSDRISYLDYEYLTDLSFESEKNCELLSQWVIVDCSLIRSYESRGQIEYVQRTEAQTSEIERQLIAGGVSGFWGEMSASFEPDKQRFRGRHLSVKKDLLRVDVGNFKTERHLSERQRRIPVNKRSSMFYSDFWQNNPRLYNGILVNASFFDFWSGAYFWSRHQNARQDKEGAGLNWHQLSLNYSSKTLNLEWGTDVLEREKQLLFYPEFSIQWIQNSLSRSSFNLYYDQENTAFYGVANAKINRDRLAVEIEYASSQENFEGVQFGGYRQAADTSQDGFYQRVKGARSLVNRVEYKADFWKSSLQHYALMKHDSLIFNRLQWFLKDIDGVFRPDFRVLFPQVQNVNDLEWSANCIWVDDRLTYVFGHTESFGAPQSNENKPIWLGLKWGSPFLKLGLTLRSLDWNYENERLQWIQSSQIKWSKLKEDRFQFWTNLDLQFTLVQNDSIIQPIVQFSFGADF